MKTSSAKAKGRRLQQWVRDRILERSPQLTEDDVRSTSMGAGGEDVQLSTAAREVFPFSVECKSRKGIAVYRDYEQAQGNAPPNSEPIVVIKENRKKPLVIVDAEYFMNRMLK